MYPRKLKGDKLDSTQDFIGSLANQSNLNISTLPSIHARRDDKGNYIISNNNRARILSSEFHYFKTAKETTELKTGILARKNIIQQNDTLNIPKRKNKNGLLSKLGKRISTIGAIGFGINNNLIDPENEKVHRSISLSEQSTNNLQKNAYEDFVNQNKMESQSSNIEGINESQENVTIPLPISKNESLNNESIETVYENKTVYYKNNQLYVNFPNESTGSLVSKLLNTYSELNIEDNQFEMENKHGPRIFDNFEPLIIENNQIYNFKRSSTYTESSANGSSKIADPNDDLFSHAQSSTFSKLSDDSNSEIRSNSFDNLTNFPNRLTTKNYHEKLTSIKRKNINQFDLRDYTDSLNAEIIDTSVPPVLPKHEILPKRQYITPETPYYDCCDTFSYTSSKNSMIDSTVKPQIEVPKDTSAFTRSTMKKYGDIKPQSVKNNDYRDITNDDDEKQRSASYQYLKNAGIDPFMLNGYQENTQLKVKNM
jgi:hypothetical protein